MSRISRTLTLFIACSITIASLAAPALGQVDPGAMADLERKRDELTGQIAETEATLGRLAIEVAALEDTAGVRRIQIELIADDLERTVDARREPASTRIDIAIVGYTQGDPRQNGLIDEIRTLEGDREPARRRVLYESVIDDTTARLDEIDTRLTEIADELSGARQALTDSDVVLEERRAEEQTTGSQLAQLKVELQDTLDRIVELRSLESRAVLTGLTTFEDPTRPALAVKIDNVPAARPQAGINQADIVFVEKVEAGVTRLAAVFHSGGAETVGPVRSMRTGDFDLLAQLNNPLFSNSGGNRGARSALANSTLIDIGVGAAPDLYWRNNSRRAPHNLFTNAYNLWSVGSALEGTATPSPLFTYRDPSEPVHPTAGAATSVDIVYGNTSVHYEWNGSSWDRSQDGNPTVDSDGVRTSPTTVVVQYTSYAASAADARSPEAITVGEGAAWILTDGSAVGARWSRPEITDQTEYRDAQGRPIAILPGRTWIELPEPDNATIS